ncbi:DEAD/DEAH box helicase family protein [Lysinibacillus capsici]|uniref:DEAD/DEAH box helicase n=1 Tax=Lysinibacillus capsici TaxID=2115968 RepID=UPI0032E52975
MFKLADFQLKAIGKLRESMEDDKKEVIFKSPTGSGKTIILTHFMDEYGKSDFNNVFVWLTPGKGNLEEQSKAKMDKYIHNSSTKLLYDVLTDGFVENDACFINWEKLTKKGNNALKETERTNLQEHIAKAHKDGLEFVVIIDESHQNDTVKANDIIELFNPKKIIRTSATPNDYANATFIEVLEQDVIAEGLIKKILVINEGFGHKIEVDSQIAFLLDKALAKHTELKEVYNEVNSIVNPLIVIQLPNNNEIVQDEVERYLATKNITYENGLLAVWLNERKENLEEIEEIDAKPIVVMIKQAIATGWDCPRAQILVKLRENTSETFEIQTIGRIRRMPEVKHYEKDVLDSCYLYTFDERFTEGVKTHFGKGALDAVKLFLKQEYRDITLISEYKRDVAISSDAKHALETMTIFYNKEYGCASKTSENKTRLQIKGYVFSDKIVKKTYTGNVHTLNKEEFDRLVEVNMIEPLNTHRHGREYHNRVSTLGLKISLPYEQMNTIIRRLFDKNVRFKNKILELETKEVYAFAINNFNKLKEDFRIALSDVEIQPSFDEFITEKEIKIPKEVLFTYDGKNRVQREHNSNVYKGYLSSAEPRSDSEKTFEKFCEDNQSVDWIYKNGDKGIDYLSIVYHDNAGKQKSFYPDYILSVKGEIWIIETKGGFSRTGDSEDIDRFSGKKFRVLKTYLEKHNLKGGFVRKDKSNNELFICVDNYSDDISGEEWQLLSDVLD